MILNVRRKVQNLTAISLSSQTVDSIRARFVQLSDWRDLEIEYTVAQEQGLIRHPEPIIRFVTDRLGYRTAKPGDWFIFGDDTLIHCNPFQFRNEFEVHRPGE